MPIIVIDPGHGGSTAVGGSSANNAIGPNGTLEKDLTLDIALRVFAAFQGSIHRVILTRTTDVNLGLRDRAAVAKNLLADVFLSIHFNGDDDSTVQGSETWLHTVNSDKSELLAKSVQQRVVSAAGYRDRGVKSKVLGVLDPANHEINTAVCLVEISFITDPNDERRLSLNAYKDSLANSLKVAIEDYINSSSGGTLGFSLNKNLSSEVY